MISRWVGWLAGIGLGVATATVAIGQEAGQAGGGPSPTATRPAASAPASVPAAPLSPEVEEILDRLEKRGETISDLSCKVRQEMKGLIVGDLIEKEGNLKYLRADTSGTNARFYIHFTKTLQEGLDLKPEWYVFDGRWFTEAKESVKQVIRREIVRPGQKLNLFSVEDSPFPLPFGQKKAEILRHFTVKLVPPEAKDPPGSKHLECIPRPGTQKEQEYKEIHFYIDPKLDLPVKIVAHRKTGAKVSEIHTVTFPDLSTRSINTGLPASDFDFKPPPGWSVSEERLQADEPRAPGAAK